MAGRALKTVVICAALLFLASALCADTVKVCFWSGGNIRTVQREVPSAGAEGALSELVIGPTAQEQVLGITSAIPAGTMIRSVKLSDKNVTVDFSREIIGPGFGDSQLDAMFQQVRWTLYANGVDKDILMTSDGALLSSYLPPLPPALYSAPVGQPMQRQALTSGVGLSGKRITVSPGHGWVWTGSGWDTQRSSAESCSDPCEDFNNIDIAQFLKKYLEADGAYVQCVREFDKSRSGTGPSGHAWWQEAAYSWLKDAGYSCSVYADYSDDCSYTGASHGTDDIRCRGLASNLDARGNTDLFLSIHTNAFDGTAKGTTVWYCDTGEHVAYGPASITLCNLIGAEVINAIQGSGEKCADGTTWACLGGSCTRYGDLGEARIAQRPACIMELGFHDNCTTDEPKLKDAFFQSVAMWGEYKAVCSYFGNTPTWDMYSDELVSTDIPTSMAPGETRTAHVTFRNRGVLWNSAHGFKMSAVGGSDPFTSTLDYAVPTDAGPGDTYTFTLSLTAPISTGYFTTDWRMQRTGYQWFGATCSRSINVGGPPDTEPPTAPAIYHTEALSSTQIGLNWLPSTDNTGVSGYNVYRNGSLHDTSLGLAYVDTSCVPDTQYSYTVSAYDGAGNESAQSNSVCVSSMFQTDYIVDEELATYTGGWSGATGPDPDCYGGDYKYGITASSETATAIWRPTLTRSGSYAVYVYYRMGANRTQFAPYTVYYNGGSQTYIINQESGGGAWVLLGTKSFVAGSSGYVKLGNNTSDTGEAVIADAVKFHLVAGPAPSTPTDGAPVVNGWYSITWQWCNQADETGYRVKDTAGVSKSGDLAANTWQWSENTLVDNTQYTRRIYAFNGVGESPGSVGQSAWTLARALESPSGSPAGNVWCSSANKSTWYGAGKAFTFSNPAGFGTGGKPSKFEYKWNKVATEAWSTSGTSWSAGTISLTATSGDGDYYLHVRAFNAINVPNNADILDYGPFKSDATPPSAVTVTDEGTYTPSQNTLKASWTVSTDASSGIKRYEYAIGTSESTQNIRGWTSAGTSTTVTATGLALTDGTKYWVQARAVDNADNPGAGAAANGITVAPGVDPISNAWPKSNTTDPLSLRNKVVTAVIGGAFWLEETDRQMGIKVVSSASVARGNSVSVAGVLGLSGTQRALIGDVVINSGGSATIQPLAMNGKSIGGSGFNLSTPGITGGAGLYNLGLLVKVFGNVTYSNSGNPSDKYFCLDDGSGLFRDGHAGILVRCGDVSPPSSGMVIVTGIVASELSGSNTVPVILTRDSADILIP